MLAAFLPDTTEETEGDRPARRPGHPWSTPRGERFRYVRMLVVGSLSYGEASALSGVSTPTLHRWRRELLDEDSPDGDTVRRLAKQRGCGRKRPPL